VIPNCCLVISVTYFGNVYNLNIYPVYNEKDGSILFYQFSILEEGSEIYIDLVYSEGIWSIQNTLVPDEPVVYYTLESNDCPVGNIRQWNIVSVNRPPFSDFTIYDTGCGGPTEDVVVEIEINNTVYNPCKYKNALIKGKRGLSEDVANLKGVEVFQLDSCKSDWSSAIAKYLAIDALKCPPYNMYTESDERCLISQLATNYKC